MKRLFVLLLILVMSSLACADPTADSLSVSSASGDPGATNMPVLINITNVVGGPIQVIGLNVSYNSSVIELVHAARGSDLPKDAYGGDVWAVVLSPNDPNDPNKRSIALTTNQQTDAIPNGFTGNIVKLYFNVNAAATPGQYPIELSVMDISSTDLVHGTISMINNGTFTIPANPGDLNEDGILTFTDATMILQTAVSGDYNPLADLSGDHSVTSLDALMLIAADPVMSVTQQPTGLAVNDTFTAEVIVDPMCSVIYDVRYELSFNPTILRASEPIPGDFLSQGNAETNWELMINNTIGKIGYRETILGGQEDVDGATKPGVLASIDFEVIGDGISPLTLSDVEYVKRPNYD